MQADVYDIRTEEPEISKYERIGIVSGISAFQKGKPLMQYLRKNLPDRKEVFVIYTYGVYRTGYANDMRELLTVTDSVFLGEYGCLGFDSFGPFKVFGPALEEISVGQEIRECAGHIIRMLEV